MAGVCVAHLGARLILPVGGSGWAGVQVGAVSACGCEMVEMAGFGAADMPAAELCRDLVPLCDVYVAVLGTRYCTPVLRHAAGVVLVELENTTAVEEGLSRLGSALDLDATATGRPLSWLIDDEYGSPPTGGIRPPGAGRCDHAVVR